MNYKLNGMDAEKLAELIGGTLILHDITNDEAFITGGDNSKLQLAEVA